MCRGTPVENHCSRYFLMHKGRRGHIVAWKNYMCYTFPICLLLFAKHLQSTRPFLIDLTQVRIMCNVNYSLAIEVAQCVVFNHHRKSWLEIRLNCTLNTILFGQLDENKYSYLFHLVMHTPWLKLLKIMTSQLRFLGSRRMRNLNQFENVNFTLFLLIVP